ncbi:polyA polymerase-like protein, partial [Dinothrombium tinctorium]
MKPFDFRVEHRYYAEYSKSSRSACKKCKSNIDKGELRLAIMVQNRFSDRQQPDWHHFDCFFKTYHPPSTADIGHFNNLKFDDQKKIESMIETQPANNASDFSVEYAKSGKSKCKLCEELIPKNEVRISKLDAEADMGYGPVKRWFHVDCFVSSRNELEFQLSGDKIPDYSMLEDKDQKMIRNKLPSLSRKHKAQKENGSEAAKRPKDDDEIALKKQSDLLYNHISEIEKMKRTDIVRLLEYNNQHVP